MDTSVSNKLIVAQVAWLLECLQENKNTQFGQTHKFSSIRNIKEYQQQVPLSHYAEYELWITEMTQGCEDVLYSGPTIAFEETSGSTDSNKMIPYSERSLFDFQSAIVPWLESVVSEYSLNHGAVYWPLSPATRRQEYTDAGIPIGMPDADYFGEEIAAFFKLIPAVPEWVAGIDNAEQWQLYTLYWLIRREDLAFISVWSPTFFIMLIEAISLHAKKLLNLFSQGCWYEENRLEPDRAAKNRLEKYIKHADTKLLWPHLKLVSCWSDGPSKRFNAQLSQLLPHASFQAKGLVSTECVVTVPNKNSQPLLAYNSGFYEFINSDNVYIANELVKDTDYEVVVTTSGGLYRYRTGDIVMCDGYSNSLPILRFQGRKGIQSDLVGEKLSEDFVSFCLSTVTGFNMLAPCKSDKPHYLLLVDANNYSEMSKIADNVESQLKNNVQYRYARKIGQLNPLKLRVIEKPLEKYINYMMNKGMRMGDIKIPYLMTDHSWLASLGEETK